MRVQRLHMRKGGRLSFLLILFFLATQFLSIFGTMCVFAYPENIGNYEDISPEHIVPLDPFLAGGHSGHNILRSSNYNTALKMLGLLPHLLFQLATLSIVTSALLRFPVQWQLYRNRTNLWLFHRALLI